MKRGNILEYYLDNNIFNDLTQDPKFADALEVLKEAKRNRKAYTYLSLYLLQELAATHHAHPALAIRLLRTARDIVVPGRGIKDTPILLREDLRRLQDRSISNEILEPRNSDKSVRYFERLDAMIETPDLEARRYQWAYENVVLRKKAWREHWRNMRKDLTQRIAGMALPYSSLEDFFPWAVESGYFLLILDELILKSVYKPVGASELMRRLDETTGYRMVVYYTLAALCCQCLLRDNKPDWGDAIDNHHAVYGSYFDVFVTNDEDCRKYAARGVKAGTRVMGLEEFIAVVRGL